MSEISYIPDQPAAQVHASLQRSLIALEEARQCSVLWFGEVMRRGLYRDLGHSSINQYAIQELGVSRSRTDDFMRLARDLENLPAVRKAVASGELGYTKAREIVSVATPETQDEWLKAAKGTRQELVNEVKNVKRAAKLDPRQGELLPSSPTVVAPPELAESIEAEKCPRGHLENRPPVQIHVHENAATGCMTVQTDRGEHELSIADAERIRCDAAVCEHGGRNTTTIPPRVRREVLGRDLHRCQVPGCARTRFLEVHHIVARQQGGSNEAENLMTLCASCPRLWHERGGGQKIHKTAPVSEPRDVLY